MAGSTAGSKKGAAGRRRVRTNGHALPRKATGESQLVVLPVLEKEASHPCFQCARCCTYIAIEIDAPTTPREYDYIEWYLYHAAVSVFVDWDDKWFVKFDARCQNLTPQGLCGIYERRPDICRDFDWRECEVHVKDDPADKLLFESAAQFLDWLRTKRPKAHDRFQAWKRKRAKGTHDRALRRLRVSELPLPPGGPPIPAPLPRAE
jgi:Fe-S-cluster containining protein